MLKTVIYVKVSYYNKLSAVMARFIYKISKVG